MGTQKKEKQRRVREGDTRDGNLRVKGENFYKDAKKVRHLQMYKTGRAKRNARGEIIQAAALQSTDAPIARVDPNRKWFGNTRVIGQDALSHFREAMGDKKHNSYQVLLRRNKLPMSLLDEKDLTESPTANITETESYSLTFGPKQQRKKPRTMAVSNLEELAQVTQTDEKDYQEKQELNATLGLMGGSFLDKEDFSQEAKEAIFNKGQSKRIWNELYKVIDSSDVVIHVLDARDPLGTRCESVEKYIKQECAHKHLIYVLNKCDLVPTWVAVSLLFFSFFHFISPKDLVRVNFFTSHKFACYVLGILILLVCAHLWLVSVLVTISTLIGSFYRSFRGVLASSELKLTLFMDSFVVLKPTFYISDFIYKY